MAEWQIVARIHNDFTDKFGIPRQSGLVPEVVSTIVFEQEYRSREALRGIEQFSHLWLLWLFSESQRDSWSPTVRPPRLGGNRRMGVFATRSPFRPNPIGLSSVKLLGVEETSEHGMVLLVSGADLMDSTPILDIKPYLEYADSHPGAGNGFVEEFVDYAIEVRCSEELSAKVGEEQRNALMAVLRQDPRPSYQHDPERIYALSFGRYTVQFQVQDDILTVVDIQ